MSTDAAAADDEMPSLLDATEAEEPAEAALDDDDEMPSMLTSDMPKVSVESFSSKHVTQVLPDMVATFGQFLGRLLQGLGTATGTHPGVAAALLPSLFAAAIGPGLTVSPNETSAWRMKANFWTAVVAESGAGKTAVFKCLGAAMLAALMAVNIRLGDKGMQPLDLMGDSKTMEDLLQKLSQTPGHEKIFLADEGIRKFQELGQYKPGGGAGADLTNMLDLRSCSSLSDSTLARGRIVLLATFVVYALGFQPGAWRATIPTAKHRDIGIEARFAPWVLPASDQTPRQLKRAADMQRAQQADQLTARQSSTRRAMLQISLQMREDEHKINPAEEQPAKSRARFAAADASSKPPKRQKKGGGDAEPQQKAAAATGDETMEEAGASPSAALTSLLDQWMTCQEQHNEITKAATAAGQATGIDDHQLDLSGVLALLLTAARVRSPQHNYLVPASLLMILDSVEDPAYGFSAQDYFERVCKQKKLSRHNLTIMGLESYAAIINKYAGNILELAAGFEAATHAVDILTERKQPTDPLPTTVSVRSLVFAVVWLGVSLCQRFMLQDDLHVIPFVRNLFPFVDLVPPTGQRDSAVRAGAAVGANAAGENPDIEDAGGASARRTPQLWLTLCKRILTAGTASNEAFKSISKPVLKRLVDAGVEVDSCQEAAEQGATGEAASSTATFAAKAGQHFVPALYPITLNGSAIRAGKLPAIKAGSDLERAVKLLGGGTQAVGYCMRAMAGEGAAVKADILKLPDVSSNHLTEAELHLDELDEVPMLGRVLGISKKMDGKVYLEKAIPVTRPDALRQELNELTELSEQCARLGIVLGQFYAPSAVHMAEVQALIQEIDERAMDNLLDIQVSERSKSISRSATGTVSDRGLGTPSVAQRQGAASGAARGAMQPGAAGGSGHSRQACS